MTQRDVKKKEVMMQSILDHGYVKLVETWGSDERIIEAARMSTSKSFQGWGTPGGYVVEVRQKDGTGRVWYLTDEDAISVHKESAQLFQTEDEASEAVRHYHETIEKYNRLDVCTPVETYELLRSQSLQTEPGVYLVKGFQTPLTVYSIVSKPPVVGDEKLLKFLYDNNHSTPFEMAGMIIEVQAPIFVFREWHRHRTQSYNELSARYTPLPEIDYIPTLSRLMVNAKTGNKQSGTIKDAAELTEEGAQKVIDTLPEIYAMLQGHYKEWLEMGVPKELARIILPVGRYSRMRASANLRNWLAFGTLRSDANPGAQWEIRQYGNAVMELVMQQFPRTYQLWCK
jgi:thymidylate synthase (FAD)